MKLPIVSALLCSVSMVASAQEASTPPVVPPVALRDATQQDLHGVPATMPPPVPLVSPSAALTSKEQHAATLSRQWR
jgi:hypothetical protein